MPCTRCGWCCEHICVIYPSHPLRDEFLLVRGWKKLQTSKDGTQVQWIARQRCPKLDGDGKCKIHSTKPVACCAYPQTLRLRESGFDPQVGIGKHCGYKWNGSRYE
jgi:Fe-S-cluster containining protein